MIDNITLNKRERNLISQKKYRLKNKDKEVARNKIYYFKNRNIIRIRTKDKKHEYYLKNKDKIKEYNKNYHQLHKEKANKEARIWYSKNRKNLILQHLRKRHETINNPKLGFSYTKEYRRIRKYKRRELLEKGGELTVQQIQQIYEDNIKLYGTLTCYLCYIPIQFGKDSIDHKIPLSRKGSNIRDNLDIAHRSCNAKKYNKTEEEYRALIKNHIF